MNNKGQTLVLFIALIPFIFILFVFAIDLANLASQTSFLKGIARDSVSYLVKDNVLEEKVKDIIYQNDKDIKIDSIDYNSICLSKDVDITFGSLFSLDKFKAKTCMKGYINNNKLVIEEKGKNYEE